MPEELAQTLCTNGAGGCGHAEEPCLASGFQVVQHRRRCGPAALRRPSESDLRLRTRSSDSDWNVDVAIGYPTRNRTSDSDFRFGLGPV
jgi:hypothetical protein